MGIFDKAKDLAAQHSDQIDDAIDKVGDAVDKRTGGKHADKVDKGQQFLKDKLDANDRDPKRPDRGSR